MRHVFVHALPAHVESARLRGAYVIVVDVLRATTTISRALEAGARAVIPVLEPDEAIRRRDGGEDGACLLGGERAGVRIAGFDLGNSPAEYTRERVAGRTIIFTTTNGTRALLHAREGEIVAVGAFSTLSEQVRRAGAQDRDVHIMCAGRKGEYAVDDDLCAGAHALALRGVGFSCGNEETAQSCERAHAALAEPGGVLAVFREAPGGRDLIGVGLERDLAECAMIDRGGVIGVFDGAIGAVTAR